MTNVLHKVIDFIHRGEQKVSHVFVSLFGEDKAAAAGHALSGLLKTEVGELVTAAVSSFEKASPALDGATKFTQAFAAVKTELEKDKKDVPDSILRFLIEAAVLELKGHFPAA